jgi:nucleotide-binding universal stress UspA family protein
VLYYLVTGKRPFGNPTSIRGLRSRLYRDPVAPRAWNPECPDWLQEIIFRCLEIAPADRFADAAQLEIALRNPDRVRLTDRATRTTRDGFLAVARRRLRLLGRSRQWPSPAESATRAPVILAAIDLSWGCGALADALQETARRLLQTTPGARLACLTVLKTPRIAVDIADDERGRRIRLLMNLKRWTRPLGLGFGRATHHVLESPDPAGAILQFAGVNRVDQILIGSRGSSTLRRYLGSVSSRVVAEAACTVTVVKTPDRAAASDETYRDPNLSLDNGRAKELNP